MAFLACLNGSSLLIREDNYRIFESLRICWSRFGLFKTEKTTRINPLSNTDLDGASMPNLIAAYDLPT